MLSVFVLNGILIDANIYEKFREQDLNWLADIFDARWNDLSGERKQEIAYGGLLLQAFYMCRELAHIYSNQFQGKAELVVRDKNSRDRAARTLEYLADFEAFHSVVLMLLMPVSRKKFVYEPADLLLCQTLARGFGFALASKLLAPPKTLSSTSQLRLALPINLALRPCAYKEGRPSEFDIVLRYVLFGILDAVEKITVIRREVDEELAEYLDSHIRGRRHNCITCNDWARRCKIRTDFWKQDIMEHARDLNRFAKGAPANFNVKNFLFAVRPGDYDREYCGLRRAPKFGEGWDH